MTLGNTLQSGIIVTGEIKKGESHKKGQREMETLSKKKKCIRTKETKMLDN